jgi:DNA-binding CsgD family transcriptional regulator
VLRDEGRFLGYYPVFRSEAMKPFGRDDAVFFSAAASDIVLGVKASALIATAQTFNANNFEPFQEVPQGVVVMDRAGKVLSLNRGAHAIFNHFALCDGLSVKPFLQGQLDDALNYIARQLRAIFNASDEITAEAKVPLVRLHSHHSGLTLRLRGLVSNWPQDSAHITVLIEVGEPENLLRQRMAARYALSPRQAELFMLLRHGGTGSEIATRLQIQPSALKSSLREMRLKLELPDLPSLRKFARAISAYFMVATLE